MAKRKSIKEKRLKEKHVAETLLGFVPISDEADSAHSAEFLQFVDTLLSESDRGAVLASVAAIDFAIGQLLKRHFQLSSKADDHDIDGLLFSPTAPIYSGGSRTALAFVLGLIDDHATATIEELRAIRNSFAHGILTAELTNERVENLRGTVPEPLRKQLEKQVAAGLEQDERDRAEVWTMLVEELGFPEAPEEIKRRLVAAFVRNVSPNRANFLLIAGNVLLTILKDVESLVATLAKRDSS